MKTIVRDIAFRSRKWLPSVKNVPLRRNINTILRSLHMYIVKSK